MLSVYVGVLLFHLNKQRPELAAVKVSVAKLSLDLIYLFPLLVIQGASLKAVYV